LIERKGKVKYIIGLVVGFLHQDGCVGSNILSLLLSFILLNEWIHNTSVQYFILQYSPDWLLEKWLLVKGKKGVGGG